MHWQEGFGIGILAALVILALAAAALEEMHRRGRQTARYHPLDNTALALLRELTHQQHGCGRSWMVPHEQEAITQLTKRGYAVIFDNELCATDAGRQFWKDNARPDAQKDRQVCRGSETTTEGQMKEGP